MNLRETGLATFAAAAIFAAPAMAQNAVETVDNAIGDVGNAAESAGNSIATGANSIAMSADNAVDVNVTTPDANLSAAPLDGNLVEDPNMMATDPMMEDANMVTTTTTRREGRSGKGSWGLLGLAGLLSFLFLPKKAAIHLDERHNRV